MNIKSSEDIYEFAKNEFTGIAQHREEMISFLDFFRTKNIKNIMEIGIYYRCTSYMLSSISLGKKIFVDTLEFPDMDKKLLSFFPEAEVIIGNSHHDETLTKVKDSLNGEFLDLLFIDGDHSYEGVKLDYMKYKELVSPGGYICFHDINDSDHHRAQNCFVGKFWNELVGEKLEFNMKEDWAGIGVLRA